MSVELVETCSTRYDSWIPVKGRSRVSRGGPTRSPEPGLLRWRSDLALRPPGWNRERRLLLQIHHADGALMVSRIMVVQRRYTGHHLAYVAMFAEWSQRVGIEMTLLVKPGTDGTPEWQEHLSPYASHLELIEGETDLEHALSVARDRGIDRIVFPGGDHYLLPILRHWRLCRKVPLTVLIMRPNGQQSAVGVRSPVEVLQQMDLAQPCGSHVEGHDLHVDQRTKSPATKTRIARPGLEPTRTIRSGTEDEPC